MEESDAFDSLAKMQQPADDYVYDVYYYTSLAPQNNLDRIGQLYVSTFLALYQSFSFKREIFPFSSLSHCRTGIDLKDLLVNQSEDVDGTESEEVEDEADEDSNDEGFYGNDYPDETKLSDYESSVESEEEHASSDSD